MKNLKKVIYGYRFGLMTATECCIYLLEHIRTTEDADRVLSMLSDEDMTTFRSIIVDRFRPGLRVSYGHPPSDISIIKAQEWFLLRDT